MLRVSEPNAPLRCDHEPEPPADFEGRRPDLRMPGQGSLPALRSTPLVSGIAKTTSAIEIVANERDDRFRRPGTQIDLSPSGRRSTLLAPCEGQVSIYEIFIGSWSAKPNPLDANPGNSRAVPPMRNASTRRRFT